MKLNYTPKQKDVIEEPKAPETKATTKLGKQQKLAMQLAAQLGQNGGITNMPNIASMDM